MPVRLLVAVAVDWLKALVNRPVAPLLTAADLAALASAAPESLLALLSELLVEVVGTDVLVVVVVDVLSPITEDWSLTAKAPPLKPNATATAEAKSVFFMKSP